jgi:preprotein translocase subunit SecE
MSGKVEASGSSVDTLKLVGALGILLAGIVGFYWLEGESLLLRVIGMLIAVGASVALALQTEKGRQLWSFATDARTEVRKVVWPTRQETIQTTLMVALMVLLTGIFLWIIDWLLMLIVRTLTGQGV